MRVKSVAKWGVDRAVWLLRQRELARQSYRPGQAPDPGAPIDWAAVRGRRVFFGHQSVGDNILDGMCDLASAAGEAAPQVISLDAGGAQGLAGAGSTGAPSGDGFLAEAHIGENGDPAAKMADFARLMRGGVGAAVDVALMKFCYVDFGRRTRPDRLFDDYLAMADRLAQEFPDVTLLHATVPLTTGPSLANALRGAFNSMLRERYAADRIIDIAALETGTTPVDRAASDGSRRRIDVPAAFARETLDPALTTDGGHLNDLGRRRVATGFLRALASATADRQGV